MIQTIRICGIEKTREGTAAISCSPDVSRFGGAGLGFWLTGKLGRAWVGAWVGAWMVWCWGVHNLPINQNPNPAQLNCGTSGLHDTAAGPRLADFC